VSWHKVVMTAGEPVQQATSIRYLACLMGHKLPKISGCILGSQGLLLFFATFLTYALLVEMVSCLYATSLHVTSEHVTPKKKKQTKKNFGTNNLSTEPP